MSLKVYVSILIIYLHTSLAAWSTEEEKRILKAKFDHGGYDPSMRPPGNITVELKLVVHEFQDLDEKSSSLTMKTTLSQRWKDPRLKFSSSTVKYLSLPSPSQVWRPDTVFKNGRSSQSEDSTSVRIYSTGDVLYTRTASVILHCPMNLRRYPFDSQTCSVLISSHDFNKPTVAYEWAEDPIGVASDNMVPLFQLAAYSSGNQDILISPGSMKSVARADFTLARMSSYTVMTVYIPMIMFLIISMMSPWIIIKDSATIFTRVVISLTPLIICSNRADDVNNKIPPVGYTKAIDVWTGWCVFFAFLYFVETMLAIYLRKDDEGTQVKDDLDTKKEENLFERFRNHSVHVKMDWITRISMPVFIFIFIIGYFGTYSSSGVSCPEDLYGEVTCLIDS